MGKHSFFRHLSTNILSAAPSFTIAMQMKMYASIVNLVLLSTLLVVYGEPQFRRYLAPYPPIFRDYPDALQPANLENPARFIFIETTSYTTVVVTSTRNCRYSTAVLAACRRRRSVEEDAYAIAPSAVTSVIPTQEASLDDARDKRHLNVGEFYPYEPEYIQSSIDLMEQGTPGFVPYRDEARLFFRIQTVTSTSSLVVTNVQSTLVTCAPLTGFLYSAC